MFYDNSYLNLNNNNKMIEKTSPEVYAPRTELFVPNGLVYRHAESSFYSLVFKDFGKPDNPSGPHKRIVRYNPVKKEFLNPTIRSVGEIQQGYESGKITHLEPLMFVEFRLDYPIALKKLKNQREQSSDISLLLTQLDKIGPDNLVRTNPQLERLVKRAERAAV